MLRPAVNAVRLLGQLQRAGLVPLRFAATQAPALYQAKEVEPMPAGFKEGPERDVSNFPHYETKMWPDKVRLAVIPDSWFQFFYEKTGVTGPYLFGGGLATYLASKEWYIVGHDTMEIFGGALALFILHKTIGPKIKAFVGKEYDQDMKHLHDLKNNIIDANNSNIEAEKTEQRVGDLVTPFFEAKRENVGLQLEAGFRQRVKDVHDEVKRRVDCLVELEESKRRFQQKHMVDWIVQQVQSSITPELEQKTLDDCISNLNLLATK